MNLLARVCDTDILLVRLMIVFTSGKSYIEDMWMSFWNAAKSVELYHVKAC